MSRTAIFLLAVFSSMAIAQETIVYLPDGGTYTLAPGENLYVSDRKLWEFTQFVADELSLVVVEPVCVDTPVHGDGFTFGGSSATTEVVCSLGEYSADDEAESSDECDVLTFGGDSCAP